LLTIAVVRARYAGPNNGRAEHTSCATRVVSFYAPLRTTKRRSHTLKLISRKSLRSFLKLSLRGAQRGRKKGTVPFFLIPPFNPTEPLLFQFTILSSTYLLIDAIFLSFYGKFSELIAKQLSGPFSKYLDKVSGFFLIFAATLLGFKDVEKN